MERSEDTLDDVGDIGVVPACGAVAKDRDWLAGFDQTDEFIDRQIGALTWAIDRKEAQAEKADAIEVAINVPQQFTADLRARVGTDRPRDVVLFRPWDIWILAINRRGRREDELLNVILLGEFEQVLRRDDIGTLIANRVFDGRTDAGSVTISGSIS